MERRKIDMAEMIAYCGLVCSSCPTFLATLDDDDAARAKTAAYYSKTYGFDLKPEEINCDGCRSRGARLIAYCQSCEIRTCCREKGLPHCGDCKEQPCGKLEAFHAFSPEAKAAFEVLTGRVPS